MGSAEKMNGFIKSSNCRYIMISTRYPPDIHQVYPQTEIYQALGEVFITSLEVSFGMPSHT
jgi:hypothetical protein